MSLTELAELIRHVDLNPDDQAAVTRLRTQLRASDSSELMKALSIAQKLAEPDGRAGLGNVSTRGIFGVLLPADVVGSGQVGISSGPLGPRHA